MTEKELTSLRLLGPAPFTTAQLAAVFPAACVLQKQTARLLRSGIILRLRRDCFCLTEAFTGIPPQPELVANVLCVPSYVTAESALRHYGLIPENVTRVQSARLGRPACFETPLGGFDYHSLPVAAFALGQRTERTASGASFVCASPAKALYDLVQLRHHLGLRSRRETRAFLIEDIRLDPADFSLFDLSLFDDLLRVGRKKTAISFVKEVIHGAL